MEKNEVLAMHSLCVNPFEFTQFQFIKHDNPFVSEWTLVFLQTKRKFSVNTWKEHFLNALRLCVCVCVRWTYTLFMQCVFCGAPRRTSEQASERTNDRPTIRLNLIVTIYHFVLGPFSPFIVFKCKWKRWLNAVSNGCIVLRADIHMIFFSFQFSHPYSGHKIKR